MMSHKFDQKLIPSPKCKAKMAVLPKPLFIVSQTGPSQTRVPLVVRHHLIINQRGASWVYFCLTSFMHTLIQFQTKFSWFSGCTRMSKRVSLWKWKKEDGFNFQKCNKNKILNNIEPNRTKMPLVLAGCRDPCPIPFSYFVQQKGYFHPFPLIVGTFVPSSFSLPCGFSYLTCFRSVYLKQVTTAIFIIQFCHLVKNGWYVVEILHSWSFLY